MSTLEVDVEDIVSPQVRSRMMAAVAQTDTVPEMAVRAILRDLGLSYRVRNGDLPGSPDIANRLRKWAVFVNGCFWHGHKNCPKTKSGARPRVPANNSTFWLEKFVANRGRDARAIRELRRSGIRVVVIWECELRRPERVMRRLAKRLIDTPLSGGV